MLTVSATLSLFHRKTSMLHCRFNTDLQNEAHPRHLCFKNADPFHSRGLCPLSPSLRLSGVPFLDDAHVLRPRILNSRACSRCPRCDTLGTSRHASVAPASWFDFPALLFLQGLFVLLCIVFSLLAIICCFTSFDARAFHDLDKFRRWILGIHYSSLPCTGCAMWWERNERRRPFFFLLKCPQWPHQ